MRLHGHPGVDPAVGFVMTGDGIGERLVRRVPTRRAILAGAAGVAAGTGAVMAGVPGAAAAVRPAAVTAAASDSTPDWFNVVSYGATGNRTTDDTAAIQAAIAACAAAGGGVVYFPGGTDGKYRITSSLTWDSPSPVVFLGDTTEGPNGAITGGSAICMDFAPTSTTAAYGVQVTGGSGLALQFAMQDLDVVVDGDNSAGSAAEYAGVYCSGPMPNVRFTRVQVCQGNGNYSVNTAIQLVDIQGSLIENCALTGETQGVWFNGGSVCTLSDTLITTIDGNGYGAIRMDGGAGTLRIRNCTTFRGDRGLIVTGSSGNVPAFVFIDDFEVNNPVVAGVEFDWGSQVWAEQLWISFSAVPMSTAVRQAVNVGPDFTGWMYLHDCVFQYVSGHGVWLQGGQGYVISNCSFGACGGNAGNTYDDLHIATGVNNVTVTGCHFDTDPFNTLYSAEPARSAIYVEPDSTGHVVTGNTFASGYGTAVVLDYTNLLTTGANSGWKPVVQSNAGVQEVTGTSYAGLSGTFSIGPYEATIGTVYRLVAWGHGTQASGTAADLLVQAVLGSTTFLYTVMEGSDFGAGNGFHWRVTVEFLITATGASAAIAPGMTFTWSEATGTTTSNAATASGDETSGATGFDSRVTNDVLLQAAWSTTSGSPTISGEGSFLQCVRN
jgi:hypothetical protein